LRIHNGKFFFVERITISVQVAQPFKQIDISGQTIFPSLKQLTIPLCASEFLDNDYTITVRSNNQSMISDDNIIITGTGINREIIITPNAYKFGTTSIDITVSNGNETIIKSFDVTAKFPQNSYIFGGLVMNSRKITSSFHLIGIMAKFV
jgi:hypothetical protein